MKVIAELVEKIDEELEGAKMYAEKYVEEKAENNNEWSNSFRTMAENELEHAMKMHSYAVQKIEKLKTVYQPSQEMLDKWEVAHKSYVDRVARIKQILTM